MALRPDELQRGKTYFALFFADGNRGQPIVETFVFIGTDFRPEDTKHVTEFTFQLARSYYQHGDWNQMTMDERDEYVDPPVINVDAPGLERFFDARALCEQLKG